MSMRSDSSQRNDRILSLGKLAAPNHVAHGFDQLGGIVADAVLENGFNIFDIFNLFRRIAFDYRQIRLLAGSDRPDFFALAEKLSAIESGNVNRLHRRESGLYQ